MSCLLKGFRYYFSRDIGIIDFFEFVKVRENFEAKLMSSDEERKYFLLDSYSN